MGLNNFRVALLQFLYEDIRTIERWMVATREGGDEKVEKSKMWLRGRWEIGNIFHHCRFMASVFEHVATNLSNEKMEQGKDPLLGIVFFLKKSFFLSLSRALFFFFAISLIVSFCLSLFGFFFRSYCLLFLRFSIPNLLVFFSPLMFTYSHTHSFSSPVLSLSLSRRPPHLSLCSLHGPSCLYGR